LVGWLVVVVIVVVVPTTCAEAPCGGKHFLDDNLIEN